ncbi:monovalent cation/H(+) antiporter subunit G [Microbispora rosea]|uniref:cation:proton antiporter n=1 Tax=Microbispora rosea TaxID=58117 RepID=UPI003439E6A1
MTTLDLLGHTLAAVGTALIAVATLGLLRLPDVLNRVNATAKAAALGVVCVLLGVLALMPGTDTAAIIGLSVVMQVVTTPLGAYALARAAYRSGAPLDARTRRDL